MSYFTTHLSFNVLVKEFLKSVNIWRNYRQDDDCFMCPVHTALLSSRMLISPFKLNNLCITAETVTNRCYVNRQINWVYYEQFIPSVLWRCWLGGRKGIRPVKNWVVKCWRGYLSGARCRLACAQLMPLPLTVSCFNKIQIGFTFLVLGHPGNPGHRAVKRVCVCMNNYQTAVDQFWLTDWQTCAISDWPTADHIRYFAATAFLLQQLCTVRHGIFYMAM